MGNGNVKPAEPPAPVSTRAEPKSSTTLTKTPKRSSKDESSSSNSSQGKGVKNSSGGSSNRSSITTPEGKNKDKVTSLKERGMKEKELRSTPTTINDNQRHHNGKRNSQNAGNNRSNDSRDSNNSINRPPTIMTPSDKGNVAKSKIITAMATGKIQLPSDDEASLGEDETTYNFHHQKFSNSTLNSPNAKTSIGSNKSSDSFNDSFRSPQSSGSGGSRQGSIRTTPSSSRNHPLTPSTPGGGGSYRVPPPGNGSGKGGGMTTPMGKGGKGGKGKGKGKGGKGGRGKGVSRPGAFKPKFVYSPDGTAVTGEGPAPSSSQGMRGVGGNGYSDGRVQGKGGKGGGKGGGTSTPHKVGRPMSSSIETLENVLAVDDEDDEDEEEEDDDDEDDGDHYDWFSEDDPGTAANGGGSGGASVGGKGSKVAEVSNFLDDDDDDDDEPEAIKASTVDKKSKISSFLDNDDDEDDEFAFAKLPTSDKNHGSSGQTPTATSKDVASFLDDDDDNDDNEGSFIRKPIEKEEKGFKSESKEDVSAFLDDDDDDDDDDDGGNAGSFKPPPKQIAEPKKQLTPKQKSSKKEVSSFLNDDDDDSGGGGGGGFGNAVRTSTDRRGSAERVSRPPPQQPPKHPRPVRKPDPSPVRTSGEESGGVKGGKGGIRSSLTSTPPPKSINSSSSQESATSNNQARGGGPPSAIKTPISGRTPIGPKTPKTPVPLTPKREIPTPIQTPTGPTTGGGGGIGLVTPQSLVKDTHKVNRKHQSLPSSMQHAMPKSGDWAKNRYIVNNYILLNVLGAGAYAEVRLAKDRNTDNLYAVKVIQRSLKQHKFGSKTSGASQTEEEVKREIAIMKKLNHPHVLRLYEVMDDPKVNKLYLVLEYMKGGDMMQLQEGDPKTYSCKPMSDNLLLRVLSQVSQGLKYLHSQNIIHGDIKPQNILLARPPLSTGSVKIADFGISKTLHVDNETLQETAGTPAFMSPQVCAGEEYDGAAADVWALGGTMYMLKFGSPPYLAKSIAQLFENIINNDVVWPKKIDDGIRKLLEGMLTKDPVKRWHLQQIYLASVPLAKAAAAAAAARSGAAPPRPSSTKPNTATSSNSSVGGSSSLRGRTNSDGEDVDMYDKYEKISVSVSEIGMSVNLSINRVYHDDDDHEDSGRDSRDSTGRASGRDSERGRSSRANAAALEALNMDSQSGLKASSNSGGASSSVLSESEEMTRAGKFQKMRSKTGVVGSDIEGSGGLGSSLGARNGPNGNVRAGASNIFSGTDDDEDEDEDEDYYDSVRGGTNSSRSNSRRGGRSVKGGIDRLDSAGFESLMDTMASRPMSFGVGGGGGQAESDKEKHSVLKYIDCLSKGKAAFRCSSENHNHKLRISASAYALKGPRDTQEDRTVLLPDTTSCLKSGPASSTVSTSALSKMAFFGVFDGHGGSGTSHLLSQRMHMVLAAHPSFCTNTSEAIKQCFATVDKEICSRLKSVDDSSGSTASVLVINHNHELVVGSVGDSRCVLSRNGKAVELSSDHRLACRPDERKRIEAAGGFCVGDRVNGTLAITRSFGDLIHKDFTSVNSKDISATSSNSCGGGVVTAVPEIMCEKIESQDEFVILASDGLWDVMSSQQAVNFIRQRLNNHMDLEKVTKEITKEAVTKQRSVDNVSVIVVALHQSEPQPPTPKNSGHIPSSF